MKGTLPTSFTARSPASTACLLWPASVSAWIIAQWAGTQPGFQALFPVRRFPAPSRYWRMPKKPHADRKQTRADSGSSAIACAASRSTSAAQSIPARDSA